MSIISGGAIFESTGFTIGLSATSAYQNVPASITTFAIGGVAPYTFSIISGSLPTGLSLNTSTGLISGTPAGSGASSFTIHATDSNSNTLSLSATVTVYVLTGTGPCSAAICVTTGSVNELATLQLIVAGYFSDGSSQNLTSLASYSCTGGSGCTGSTISSTGLFTAGSTAGSATVRASFSSINGTGTVTVMGTNPVITYPTSVLPNGQQYQPYSEGITGTLPGQGIQILISGGVAPYTCSVMTGSLPTGMALSNVAGNTNCLIGGTPTTSGAGSSITLKVVDSASNSGTVTLAGGITVVALSSLVVNLAQSSIVANTTTTASALGNYTDSSYATLPNGQGAGAFVQKQSAFVNTTLTSVATPAMGTTTGNMLVVFQMTGQGGTTCPTYSVPTDNAGNTYAAATTSIGGPPSPPPFYNCGQIFYAFNITGNAANVTTCHTSSVNGMGCVVLEYTNVPTTDPRDQHPAPTQANPASACTPNSVTTAQANEIGFIVCLPNSATGYTLPSGYVSRDSNGLNWIIADQTYSTTTTTAPVTSFSGGATGEDSFIVTFKSNTPTAGGIIWSSATPSCATISSMGVITGQGVQSTCTSVITATVGAVNSTATVTVTPTSGNTDTAIVINPIAPTQGLGLSVQFTATGNNTGQTYAATWGSSNTTVATIGVSSGLATCTQTGGTTNINASVSGFSSVSVPLTCTQAAVIDWSTQHQVIDGFSAVNTDEAGTGTVTTLTAAQAATFFGTGNGQIGLSILRTAPPINDSPSVWGVGDCRSVGTSCLGVYASDISFAASYGVGIYVSPFAAPAIYTTNNSVICTANGGSGQVATAHYQDFANWLLNYIKSIQTLTGASIVGINVQNEPDLCESAFPSTLWTATELENFIKNNLGPTLASNGLSSVKIFLPESPNYASVNGLGYACLQGTDPTCAGFVAGISFHDYDARVTGIPGTPTVNATPYQPGWSGGGRQWVPEVSCQSGGGGPNWCTATWDASMATNGIYWAGLLDHRLAVDGVNEWGYFWFLIQASNNIGEALMDTATSTLAKRGYVMGQYSRFIRPGYFRIDATHAPQSGVTVSAYQNTTSENLVIVATNYTTSSTSQTFSIANTSGISFSTLTPYITSETQSIQALPTVTVTNNTFSYTLPATSVITFVGTGGVNTVTLQSISISPGSTSVLTGAQVTYAATGNYSDNSTQNLTPSAAWASSNTSVATVSGNVATCLSNGSTTISATYHSVVGTASLICGTSTWAGILDPTRAIDWTTAGVQGGIPSASWVQCVTSACQTVTTAGSASTAAQIQAAIDSALPNTYVLLPAGTYNLSTGLYLHSNVVLRGAGANQTFLVFNGHVGCFSFYADVCFSRDTDYQISTPKSANWTAGYTQGATSITLTNVGTTGITNGQFIMLGQADALATNNNFFVCSSNTSSPACSLEAGSIHQTVNGLTYSQWQNVQVTGGCATTCTGAGPFTVTISPGLYAPNWSSSSSPVAWWSYINQGATVNAGLENLSLDGTNDGQGTNNGSISGLWNVYNSWVSGVRSINCSRVHVWINDGAHNTIQNSYFYGTLGGTSTSYGMEMDFASSNLLVNNIYQRITTAVIFGNGAGNVIAYNYEIYGFNTLGNSVFGSFAPNHDAGTMYNLYEGNLGAALSGDAFHGTGGFHTAFRNTFLGWEPTFNNSLIAVQMAPYNRYWNIIGNVLGTPNITALYTGTQIFGGFSGSAIYTLGLSVNEHGITIPTDSAVATTLMRWGNYDSVNAANRFVSGEVPSGISPFANAVPSNNNLPASFAYLSQPSWWPAGKPWPPTGPDVTGGNVGQCTSGTFNNAFALSSGACAGGTFSSGVNGGHINSNPAMDCYFNHMSGTTDGTGPVLAFDPTTCPGFH